MIGFKQIEFFYYTGGTSEQFSTATLQFVPDFLDCVSRSPQ
jgi:hypothetical protein